MKKLGCLILCALMLALVLTAAGALAEAAEPDFAITLTADLTEVNAGQKVTLTADFANPETVNKAAKNNQITWTLTDAAGNKTNAGSINANGVVNTQRNIKEKTVLIATAAAKSMPSQTASLEITVTPIASKVSIQADTDLIYPQEGFNTVQLTAAVEPADAAQAVTWQSANEKVATVDENGLVTAVAKGTVNITATAEDGSKVRGTIRLTVGVPVGKLDSMSWNGTRYMQAGKGNLTFSVRDFYDAEGNKVNPTNKNLTWSIRVDPESAESCVSIDKNGRLTAAKECPAAMVTVTAAADGSLPAGSATYSVDGIYVLPTSAAETVPAENIDVFWGDWEVFMTADAKGNPSNPTSWFSKLGGLSDLRFSVVELDGAPYMMVYADGQPVGGMKAYFRDGTLYIDQGKGAEDHMLAELCADGTLREYGVYYSGDPSIPVYCFHTYKEKFSVNTQEDAEDASVPQPEASGDAGAAPADMDPEALLEAVTEATGGIPDALGELEERYALGDIDLLYEQLEPLHFMETLMAEGTCSFPALDGDWTGGFLNCNNENIPMDMKVSDGQVTLTLGNALPEGPRFCYLDLNYSNHTEIYCHGTTGSENEEENGYTFFVHCTANGHVNGSFYIYEVGRNIDPSKDASLYIAIYFYDSNYQHVGTWWGYYDENGMLNSKEFTSN